MKFNSRGKTLTGVYDNEGQLGTYREPAITALQHLVLQNHESRLKAIEAKLGVN